jgi:hypothetical protein
VPRRPRATREREPPPNNPQPPLLVLEKGRVLDGHGGIDVDGGGWALAETDLAAAHKVGGSISVETLKASAVIGRRLGSVIGGEGIGWFHGAVTVGVFL